MTAFALENLMYMWVKGLAAPRFWWYTRTGREALADAISHRMTLVWTDRIFRRLGCEVRVEGLEHLRTEGPLMVMANHQAIYDIPLLLGFTGRAMGFVYKRELARIPALRYWMNRNHCVAIDRADARGAADLYRNLADWLQESGRALVLFPEGTRSRDPDGALGPFRRGSLRLAQAGDIPIQPIVLDGTRFLVNPARLAGTPKGKRTASLRVLPARQPPAGGAPEAKAFMEALREEMVQVREEIRVEWDPS